MHFSQIHIHKYSKYKKAEAQISVVALSKIQEKLQKPEAQEKRNDGGEKGAVFH